MMRRQWQPNQVWLECESIETSRELSILQTMTLITCCWWDHSKRRIVLRLVVANSWFRHSGRRVDLLEVKSWSRYSWNLSSIWTKQKGPPVVYLFSCSLHLIIFLNERSHNSQYAHACVCVCVMGGQEGYSSKIKGMVQYPLFRVCKFLRALV